MAESKILPITDKRLINDLQRIADGSSDLVTRGVVIMAILRINELKSQLEAEGR